MRCNSSNIHCVFSTKSVYPFGFNGLERDDEIAGKGNFNKALCLEYDTRFGRRWNVDPKPLESISSYATFSNNSIIYNDISGDTVEIRGEVNIGPPSEFAKLTRFSINQLTQFSKTSKNIYNELDAYKFQRVFNFEDVQIKTGNYLRSEYLQKGYSIPIKYGLEEYIKDAYHVK